MAFAENCGEEGGSLEQKHMTSIICDVFYKREAYCNKKEAAFKDQLKKQLKLFIYLFLILLFYFYLPDAQKIVEACISNNCQAITLTYFGEAKILLSY